MRTFTLFMCLVATISLAQQPALVEGSANTGSETASQTIAIESTNGNPLVATYSTLSDFQKGVSLYCPDPTLTSENFEGGPISITLCGPSIGSFGNLCFDPGVLEDGFTILASDLGNVVYVPAGGLGNVIDPLIGANSDFHHTIVTYDPEVYAMAMEIWVNAEPVVQVRVFGSNGDLIEATNLTIPLFKQTFFGVIADEPIARIEVETAHNSAGLIGKFLYGAVCENIAGVDDKILSQIRLSPNPAEELVRLQLPSGVELLALEVYDIAGKLLLNEFRNNQIQVAHLSQGIYLVRIKTSEGTITRKITKR